MDGFISEYPVRLLEAYGPPCLSLYQPTHRQQPEKEQDSIRYRNLLREMEESLGKKYQATEIGPMLEPFRALADDRDFWNHTLDGLAVLGAPGMFQVFKLQRPVAELTVVADSFHTKPLMRILQSADRFQILGISREEVKLFEGNRDAVDQIELAPGVPRTITEALGEELTEPYRAEVPHGDGGVAGPAIAHGQGSKKDEVDKDRERFFRIVDKAILEHHSQPSGLPLLLAALPEHHNIFHTISHNPFLIKESIDVHPDALTLGMLRDRAWNLIEPRYQEQLEGLIEAYGLAQSRGLGTDDLAQIAEATVAGRVDTLLIEADRIIPGRLDEVTGRIEFGEFDNPDIDDLLDDLGEKVLRMGGRIIVVPREQMPTESGAAAIYRF